jgi:hypothetical protein
MPVEHRKCAMNMTEDMRGSAKNMTVNMFKGALAVTIFALCSISIDAKAQVIVTDPKTEVSTDLGYLEAAKSYLQQGQQYYMQGEQYYEQLEQAAQEIQNAKGLANIASLGGGSLDSDISRLESVTDDLSDLYSLNGFSGNFSQEAREVLSRTYNLPGSTSAQASAASLMGLASDSPTDAGYDRAARDTNQSMREAASLASVNEYRQASAQVMQRQDEALADLGDDDVGASTQLIAAEQSTALHQNDASLQLQQTTADMAFQQHIRQLEVENDIAEKNLKHLQKVQAFTASSD